MIAPLPGSYMVEEPTQATNAAKQLSDPQALTTAIAEMAWGKNAFDTKVFDVQDIASFTDIFILFSGRSDRHVIAIASAIETGMKKMGLPANGVEGRTAGTWVLMDYGDVVVHIFESSTRGFYELERLWSDAKEIPMTEPKWVQDFAKMEAGGDPI